MRFRIGYQLSIIPLFVAIVVTVGLAPVVLNFDRARSIARSAALTFLDRAKIYGEMSGRTGLEGRAKATSDEIAG